MVEEDECPEFLSLYDDLPPPKCTPAGTEGVPVPPLPPPPPPAPKAAATQVTETPAPKDTTPEHTAAPVPAPAPARTSAATVQHLQALRARLKTQQHQQQHTAAAHPHASAPEALTDPFLAPGLYDCERPNDYQAICAERARVLAAPVPPPPPLPTEAPTTIGTEDEELDGVPWEPPAGWQDPYATPGEGDTSEDTRDRNDAESRTKEADEAEQAPEADAELDGTAWTLPAAISAAQARALARAQATAFARAFVAELEERQRRRRRTQSRRRTQRAAAAAAAAGAPDGDAIPAEDDVGARMLQNMGWVPGTGLGA